ncbi:hypothetical protein LTR48_007809, partial [Friedmanniomyces endolithicus]
MSQGATGPVGATTGCQRSCRCHRRERCGRSNRAFGYPRTIWPYRCHWCTWPYRVDLRLQLPRMLRPDWIEDLYHRSSLDHLPSHLLHSRRQHLQQDLFSCGLHLLRHGQYCCHRCRLLVQQRACLCYL